MLFPPLPLSEMLQIYSLQDPATAIVAAVAAALVVFLGGFLAGAAVVARGAKAEPPVEAEKISRHSA
ncbi:MAG: hypothetical protein K6U87_13185 [Firmicutes bacterium]|nr:hypothetical protein [Bacillota bacterium]